MADEKPTRERLAWVIERDCTSWVHPSDAPAVADALLASWGSLS